MCGIAGVLSFDGAAPVDISLVQKMRDTMPHRGPDGTGLWASVDGTVGLGHRRLSIIDLSETAAQPMSNTENTLHLVFNGEIYNHAEIRRELEGRGHRHWKTDHSDTEVILRAFDEWGIECIERFRGMFAFALWDSRRRELWLVRDRIGIKPLYFSARKDRLAFASEIKALLADPNQPREVDEEALFYYLSFLIPPAPFTLFEGIQKLPGGTWMRVRPDGTIHEHRYWDVWDNTTPMTDVPTQDIAERVLEEVRTSVRYRKVADVQVGVFLSGGVDSSTNAALFAEGEGEPIKTFSIGYEGDYASYTNELDFARKMAAEVGADHHELLLTLDDLLDFLPRMVELQDEPIADPVCVPVYYVSKLARDNGVTVCQVGEGADELFCGYPFWGTMIKLQRYSNRAGPAVLKRLGMAALGATGRREDIRYEWLRRASRRQPIFWSGAEAFTEAQKQRLLSPRLRERFADRTSWEPIAPIYNRYKEKAWEQAPLNWMSYSDLNLRLPELLLMRVDKMSMGVSLEGRVPFLDHKLVELAMSIPARERYQGSELKRILKRAVRNTVPDEIIDRPKQGFGVPVQEYFYDRLGDVARTELTDLCRQTDFFDSRAIDDLLSGGSSPQIWYLLNFALWWKTYLR